MTITHSLSGRTALVTGGARGIGLGITRALAARGADVIMIGRSAPALVAAEQSLADLPGAVSGCIGDISNPAACQTMINTIHQQHPQIDILCSNAGIFPSAMLDTMTPDDLQQVFSTNVFGTFYMLQAVMADLRASTAGRVILTSSITGPQTGYPGWSHYGASKAAQLGLMRSAALELAPDGVTVNAVLPGNVATEGLDEMGPDYITSMEASVPLGRLGSVDEIGATVAFLCSPGAGFITGQAITVDGGQTLPECPDAIITRTEERISA